MGLRQLGDALRNPRLLALPLLPLWYAWWAIDQRGPKPRTGGHPQVVDVPRRTGVSLREAIDSRMPMVLTDIASRWPAAKKWNPAYLKSTMVDRDVWALVGSASVRDFADGGPNVSRKLRLKELVEILFDREPEEEQRYYTTGIPLDELGEDVEVPSVPGYSNSTVSVPALWLGQDGNLTPLHYDAFHGFLTQFLGRKRVTLIPPQDSPFLPITSPFGARRCQTKLPPNCAETDPNRFPDFFRATRYVATLNPGDMLHIPLYWWHQVELFEPNVSMTLRYDPNWHELVSPAVFPVAYATSAGSLISALRS